MKRKDNDSSREAFLHCFWRSFCRLYGGKRENEADNLEVIVVTKWKVRYTYYKSPEPCLRKELK